MHLTDACKLEDNLSKFIGHIPDNRKGPRIAKNCADNARCFIETENQANNNDMYHMQARKREK